MPKKTLVIGCLGILILAAVLVFSIGTGTYNTLSSWTRACGQWAQVENVYQRRADLVPNLVETVKGAANFEKETYTAVTEARAKVGQMSIDETLVNDPEKLAKFQQARMSSARPSPGSWSPSKPIQTSRPLRISATSRPSSRGRRTASPSSASASTSPPRRSTPSGRASDGPHRRPLRLPVRRESLLQGPGRRRDRSEGRILGLELPGPPPRRPRGGRSLSPRDPSGRRPRDPPAPDRWATDEAGFLSASTVRDLDRTLEDFETRTGHQVLVYIGTTTEGLPVEDWASRAFQAWRVGRRGLDDGLVLFIMAEDRRIRVEVGYGLEAIVPDITADASSTTSSFLASGTGPTTGPSATASRPCSAPSPENPARGCVGTWGFPARRLSVAEKLLVGAAIVFFLILFITNPSLAFWLLINILSGGRGGGGSGRGSFGGAGAAPAAGGLPDHGERREDAMLSRRRRRLLKMIDRDRVLEAIGAAERCSSGEIRVSVAPFFWAASARSPSGHSSA